MNSLCYSFNNNYFCKVLSYMNNNTNQTNNENGKT